MQTYCLSRSMDSGLCGFSLVLLLYTTSPSSVGTVKSNRLTITITIAIKNRKNRQIWSFLKPHPKRITVFDLSGNFLETSNQNLFIFDLTQSSLSVNSLSLGHLRKTISDNCLTLRQPKGPLECGQKPGE